MGRPRTRRSRHVGQLSKKQRSPGPGRIEIARRLLATAQ